MVTSKRRLLSCVLIAVLITLFGNVMTAGADVSAQTCRDESPVSTTGGAMADVRLCYTPQGDGYFEVSWDGLVTDLAVDSSGAAAQIRYDTPINWIAPYYQVHGAGHQLRFGDHTHDAKNLRVRVCQINKNVLRHCSGWY